MNRPDLSFYLVLDRKLCGDYGMIATALDAAAAGATMIQLRDKEASTASMIETGRALKAALAGSRVKLIVNDDVEAALAIEADGLHIGQDDGDPQLIRARIGHEMLLGLSAETEELAARIDPAIVDHAGIGPVFATPVKPDHKPPIGFAGLARLVAAARVPVVAIGGLQTAHVADVFAAGADGIAVVSAICGQPSPFEAARALDAEIRKFKR
jgi:thiamine-phosphate pyrophosphorylase